MTKRKKGHNRGAKGGNFEREFCTQLSLWWSHRTREDIFWRSSTSGARATTRSKRGKGTFGQYGDVAAIDPIGNPLLDVMTIELKRGYNSATVQDVLDKQKGNKIHKFEEFLQKTIRSHEASGSFAWMLVTRRTRREAIVWMPKRLFLLLLETTKEFYPGVYSECRLAVRMDHLGGTNYTLRVVDMIGFPLNFFWEIKPETFLKLSKVV